MLSRDQQKRELDKIRQEKRRIWGRNPEKERRKQFDSDLVKDRPDLANIENPAEADLSDIPNKPKRRR